jgi:Mrp family chromosome partitioning ATPase
VPIAPDSPKLAVVMVGLPARGKSYTARRIERYLSWLGYRTGVFNVGEYRRRSDARPGRGARSTRSTAASATA